MRYCNYRRLPLQSSRRQRRANPESEPRWKLRALGDADVSVQVHHVANALLYHGMKTTGVCVCVCVCVHVNREYV